MDTVSGAFVLLTTSAIIGVTHTLMGPDHYLPFVALGKARRWSLARTLSITFLCGLGHVGASVLIGVIGILAGWSLASLEAFESVRGELTGWLLIVFGVLYLLWALRQFGRKQSHSHVHMHADGIIHEHPHNHQEDSHAHSHTTPATSGKITTWTLVVVFLLGPCEALIPVLLFPALSHDAGLAVGVVTVFAITTIATMVATVWALSTGVRLFRFKGVGRYGHVAAGLVLLTCGAAIQLGL